MTESEINAKIAGVCGWKQRRSNGLYQINKSSGPLPDWVDAMVWINPVTGGENLGPPSYAADLNAIHEAEKTLTKEQCRDYQSHLMDVVTHGSPSMKECEAGEGKWCARWTWNATALQRCEAFLRTLNLWTEPQPAKDHES